MLEDLARRMWTTRRPGRAWAAMFCGLIGALAWSGHAAADPCLAVPEAGPAPPYLSPGSSFSGPVVYIVDGDGLCVDTGGGPTGWVEVRLADFYAPELASPEGTAAKRDLEQLSLGRRLDCVAQKKSYDRIVARCRLEGRSLGDLLREAGGSEGGRAFPGLSASFGAAETESSLSPRTALAFLQGLPVGLLAAVSAVLVTILALIWRKPARAWRRRAGAKRAFRLFQEERKNASRSRVVKLPVGRRHQRRKPERR